MKSNLANWKDLHTFQNVLDNADLLNFLSVFLEINFSICLKKKLLFLTFNQQKNELYIFILFISLFLQVS